jgi:hypothetical protein
MMSIQDHLRKLTDRAEDLGAEHKAELEKAIAKAEQAADRQTGGKYHEQIEKAGEKAGAYVQGLKPSTPDEDPPTGA